ncbi:MAG: hypothetical protein IPO07_30655 [Haliscomenobacter sp.]|nr:hypothetical protein [Haliscomenobacter sp.]MBK9492651.1 hypothetical protein [Haliscomenobacter sp.]
MPWPLTRGGAVRSNQQLFTPAEIQGLEGAAKHLSDFQLKALHVAPNGSLTLVAEQFLPPFRGNGRQFYGQVLMVSYSVLGQRKLNMLLQNPGQLRRGVF